MTLSNLYVGKAVVINGAATPLYGITKQSYDPRAVNKNYGNSGAVHTYLSSFVRYAPVMKFSTMSVATLLGTGYLTNVNTPMAALNGTSGLLLTLGRVKSDAPGYDSTAHRTLKMASGQIYLDSLNWSGGAEGLTADCTAYGISADGTTDPVTPASSTTLPSDGAETPWQLTGATIDGVACDSVQSFSATFAHGAENNTEGAYTMGLPFPVRVVPPGAGGAILISGELDIMDQSFSLPNSGAIVLTFQQSQLGAGFSSGAGAQVLTFSGAAIEVAPMDAGQGVATRKVKFTCTYVPSTYPFAHTP
jgi:hypothetical protein